MNNVLALLPIYMIIAVIGILVIAVIVFVQAAVRTSRALELQARAIQDIAESLQRSRP